MPYVLHIHAIGDRQAAARAHQTVAQAVLGHDIDIDTALEGLLQAKELKRLDLGLRLDDYDQANVLASQLEDAGCNVELLSPDDCGLVDGFIRRVAELAVGDQVEVGGDGWHPLTPDTTYEVAVAKAYEGRIHDHAAVYTLAPLSKRDGSVRSTGHEQVTDVSLAIGAYRGIVGFRQVDAPAEVVEAEQAAPSTAVAVVHATEAPTGSDAFLGDEAAVQMVQVLGRFADADDLAGALNLLALVDDVDLLDEVERTAAVSDIPARFLNLIGDRARELRRAPVPEPEVRILRRRTEHLECHLSDDERNRMARRVTDLTMEIDDLEAKRARVAKRLKAEADLKRAELEDLRVGVQTGVVWRDVPVEHRWANGDPFVRVVRTDTGAVMDSRTPTDEERQERLNMGAAAR